MKQYKLRYIQARHRLVFFLKYKSGSRFTNKTYSCLIVTLNYKILKKVNTNFLCV